MVIVNIGKDIQQKATKHLLDTIILRLVSEKPMCGYEIMTAIKKTYGIYFGASTIYPMLNNLEKRKLVKSQWDTNSKRPKRIYSITQDGHNTLHIITSSLTQICKSLESIKNETAPIAFSTLVLR